MSEQAIGPSEHWLDHKVAWLNREQILYTLLILLAIASRFVMLGARVASHDEAIHTRYSWELYQGYQFRHNPLMHGPFLFHATAASYWLLGDNDATARVPVAVMGVVLVAFPYLLRRPLGRSGALAASLMLLISPSILYYSRYIRMDIPIIFWALVLVGAMWGYIQRRSDSYLLWFAAGLSLMFATKEVAYLYVAILGSFVAVRLAAALLSAEWTRPQAKVWYQVALIGLLLGAMVLGAGALGMEATKGAAASTDAPEAGPGDSITPWRVVQIAGGGLLGLSIACAAAAAVIGIGAKLCDHPTFDLVILFSTLGLPFLAAVPLKLLGSNPLDYAFSIQALAQIDGVLVVAWACLLIAPFGLILWRYWQVRSGRPTHQPGWALLVFGYALAALLVVAWTVLQLRGEPNSAALRSSIVLVATLGVSAVVGLWWDRRRWLSAAGVF